MPPEMLKFVDDIYIVVVVAAAAAVLCAIAVADLQLPLAFVLIVVLLDGHHAAAADLHDCLYTRNFDGIDPRIKSHHHKRRYCYRDNHCFYGSCVVSRLHLLRRTLCLVLIIGVSIMLY